MDAPTPPPASLDAQALARLRELDPEGRLGVVQRVLTAFETSLERMLGQLQALQPEPEPSQVAHIAHTLKSSSASVGALTLSQVCAEVETRIRKGDTSAMHLDTGRLISEGRSALQAVRAILRP